MRPEKESNQFQRKYFSSNPLDIKSHSEQNQSKEMFKTRLERDDKFDLRRNFEKLSLNQNNVSQKSNIEPDLFNKKAENSQFFDISNLVEKVNGSFPLNFLHYFLNENTLKELLNYFESGIDNVILNSAFCLKLISESEKHKQQLWNHLPKLIKVLSYHKHKKHYAMESINIISNLLEKPEHFSIFFNLEGMNYLNQFILSEIEDDSSFILKLISQIRKIISKTPEKYLDRYIETFKIFVEKLVLKNFGINEIIEDIYFVISRIYKKNQNMIETIGNPLILGIMINDIWKFKDNLYISYFIIKLISDLSRDSDSIISLLIENGILKIIKNILKEYDTIKITGAKQNLINILTNITSRKCQNYIVSIFREGIVPIICDIIEKETTPNIYLEAVWTLSNLTYNDNLIWNEYLIENSIIEIMCKLLKNVENHITFDLALSSIKRLLILELKFLNGKSFILSKMKELDSLTRIVVAQDDRRISEELKVECKFIVDTFIRPFLNF